MNENESFDITVGSGVVGIFQSTSYKLERVFAEFIDNSLQNYLDHEEELKAIPSGEGKICKVDILWTDDYITIEDNSYGMSKEEFGRALKLNSVNPRAQENDRLSIYGIGLNYAAASLCDKYSISSSRFGDDFVRTSSIDIKDLISNNPTNLSAIRGWEDKANHYTKIKLTKLRVKKTVNKIEEVKEQLGIIYKYYIKNKILDLQFNNVPVNFKDPEFRVDENGQKYVRNVSGEFSYGENVYRYSGWIGILNQGKQAITGLRLFQANRCILNYKPKKIFKTGNSFQNQRIIGEIIFSGSKNIVSYDKSKFIWGNDDDNDNLFIKQLYENTDFVYIVKICEDLKKKTSTEKFKSIIQKDVQRTNKSFDASENFSSIASKISDEYLNITKAEIESSVSSSNNENVLSVFTQEKTCTESSFDKQVSLSGNKNASIKSNKEAEEDYKFALSNSKEVTLKINLIDKNSDDDLFTLTNPESFVYILSVNKKNLYFDKYITNSKTITQISWEIIIGFIMSIIHVTPNGLNATARTKLIEHLNDYIIKKANG